MKKNNSNIKTLVALVMTETIFAACSNDIIDEPAQSVDQTTYSMIVNASKAGDTRALNLDGKTLSASWAVGEEVSVYNITRSADITGTLRAQSAGVETTLEGTLTGKIANGDRLKLKFLSPNYISQAGTLEYIAANCDYAEADVTVSSASGGKITTTDAAFTNQQTIVKFTLIDKADGTTPISASFLNVSDGINSYNITPAATSNELYVAMPGFSGRTVTITATNASGIYSYMTPSKTSFSNGQYYSVRVKLTKSFAVAAATNSDKGKVIGADGNVYDNSTVATIAGTTAVAMITYVGSPGSVDASSLSYKGLAIALSEPSTATGYWGTSDDNAGLTKYNTLATAQNDLAGISNTSTLLTKYSTESYAANLVNSYRLSIAHPTGTSDWFLPSCGQWVLLLRNYGASITSSNSFGNYFPSDYNLTVYNAVQNALLLADGEDAKLVDDNYWTSTEYSEKYGVRVYFSKPHGVGIVYTIKEQAYRVRPFLAF